MLNFESPNYCNMQYNKTLYRSRTDVVLGGVAGGLGKYFNIDPLIFRLLFVAFTFLAGGVLAYIILWIIVPNEPWEYSQRFSNPSNLSNMDYENTDYKVNDDQGNKPYPVKPRNDGSLIAGILLIAVGGVFLIDRIFPRISFSDIWPVLLIVFGVVIIATQLKPKNKF